MVGSDPRQRTALVVTVLDEEDTIEVLLASIAAQTRRPDEVVIVDGGSRDATWDILQTWRPRLPLRLIQAPGASIAQGRNLGIEAASADLIAVTDAGVRLDADWLTGLLLKLDRDVDVVSGFFQADPRTVFERALGATVLPALADVNPERFLPSSRSVLFRRAAWVGVGGYPGWLDYGEDLVFDLALKRAGYAFAFASDAIAWFRPRGTLRAFFRQYYLYARGDGKADLWLGRHLVRYTTYAAAATWPVAAAAACGGLLWRRRTGLMRLTPPTHLAPKTHLTPPRHLAPQTHLSPQAHLTHLTPPTYLISLTRLAAMALLALGAFAYTRRPYQRLLPHLSALSWQQRSLALALVPMIRLVGDAAKMLGYPVGVWWRLTQGPQTRTPRSSSKS